MRPVMHGDVVAAARVLFGTPDSAREATLRNLVREAEWADAYRRETGRAHPLWGDGSLMCAALKHRPPPEPSLQEDIYCSCLVQVLEGLADWRGGGAAVNRPLRRRCRWTPWGRVQAV